MQNAMAYDLYKKLASQDGEISDEEREKLNFFLDKIFEESRIRALKDGTITPDESQLLAKISEFVREMKER